MKQVFKSHKGTLPVKIEVMYQDQDLRLDFMSTKNKVDVTGELLGELEELGVYYKLN
ncbi:MAG: hypothetical protein IPJ43_12135 [Saprospiraceae bacterium]|nr:hypothetical protein [Saprospiraceae bacterium]